MTGSLETFVSHHTVTACTCALLQKLKSLPSLRRFRNYFFDDFRPSVFFFFQFSEFVIWLFRSTLGDLMGEMFMPCEMPEPPKEGFFKGLFGGGVRPLDREELCKSQMKFILVFHLKVISFLSVSF